MKKIISLIAIGALAAVLAGCSKPANNANNTRNNSNIAIANTPVATPANTNTDRWNSKISKEEYEKNRAEYEKSKKGDSWGTTLEESWLWFKVRSALMMANNLLDSTIDVDVAKDVVTLKGTVATDAQKKKAEEVAKGVEGVIKVVNQLKAPPKDSTTNSKQSMTDSDKPPAPTKK